MNLKFGNRVHVKENGEFKTDFIEDVFKGVAGTVVGQSDAESEHFTILFKYFEYRVTRSIHKDDLLY